MKKKLKRNIGNIAINLGKHAVGKCMIPGMYDPKIPDEIKKNIKNPKKIILFNKYIYVVCADRKSIVILHDL